MTEIKISKGPVASAYEGKTHVFFVSCQGGSLAVPVGIGNDIPDNDQDKAAIDQFKKEMTAALSKI